MEFNRRQTVIKEEVLEEEYPHVLLLYKKPPIGEISLPEFEELAYDRVQTLRILEQASLMGHKIYSTEWKNVVIGYLRKQGLRRYVRLLESTGFSSADADQHIRREDYISHYILRLAYCRSLDLRNWFIAREIEMFKMRFLNLSPEGIRDFIKVNKLDYFPISSEEKDVIKHGLVQSTAGYSQVQIENSDFYKVPFTEVLDLVRNTSVYIHKGYAYIPTSELVSCIISWFRVYLNDSLVAASKKLPSFDDERINGLLSSLHVSYTGKDYSVANTDSGITADNLHLYVRKSFPLCMQSLYNVIKTTHHMKHFGRLQFGLFLKGIGLSLDEAIKYWRTEFCKSIDADAFNKKYLYNIKHSYGTIGKMANYSPYGCKKVISAEPGPGEHHGCPFKLWDSNTLKQKILENGVNMEGAKEITEIASKGHFQIACSKYFMYMHNGTESKQVINHPNQYFDESVEIIQPKDEETIKSRNERKKVYATPTQTSQSSNETQSQTQTSNTTYNEDMSNMFDEPMDLN